MIMKMVQPSDGSLDSQLIMMRMTMMIVIMFYKMQENVKDNVRIIQYFGSPKFQRPRLSHRWSPPSRTSVRKETLFSCQPENIKSSRGEICHCRHCRRQCKFFASGVNVSIFTHFLCFFLLKLLKLGEIDGVTFLA